MSHADPNDAPRRRQASRRRRSPSSVEQCARIYAAIDILSNRPYASARTALGLVEEWTTITERVGSLLDACIWASDSADPETLEVMRAFARSVQSSHFIDAGTALVTHAAHKLTSLGAVTPQRLQDATDRLGRAARKTHSCAALRRLRDD